MLETYLPENDNQELSKSFFHENDSALVAISNQVMHKFDNESHPDYGLAKAGNKKYRVIQATGKWSCVTAYTIEVRADTLKTRVITLHSKTSMAGTSVKN
jgi:hypothetical protein